MNYNEKWRVIEESYDTKYITKKVPKQRPSLLGLNLSDFLIIKNWLAYANGIGDQSANIIANEIILSNQFYNKGKERLLIQKKNPFYNDL